MNAGSSQSPAVKARLSPFPLFSIGTMFWMAARHDASLDTNRIEQPTDLRGTWSAAEGVFHLEGGLDAWEKAGHSIEKKTQP